MSKYITAGEINALIMMNTEAMLRMVEKTPENIVRCKDCKYNYGIANHCEYAKDDIVCCYWESDGLHSDDFCSKGEREETN